MEGDGVLEEANNGWQTRWTYLVGFFCAKLDVRGVNVAVTYSTHFHLEDLVSKVIERGKVIQLLFCVVGVKSGGRGGFNTILVMKGEI